MNAGTIQCKCGIHYTARDPHPLCKNCSARSCSRSHPCSFCLRLSPSEWDLWLDQEARTSDFGSKRFLEEPSSPATEGLGSSQDDKFDSNKESPGNSRSGSSGEVLSLASHTGGEARIANLETGLSSLQASLSNISSLLILSSRSLGWDQDSSDLSTPGYASLRRRACFRGSWFEVFFFAACDPSFCGVTCVVRLPTVLFSP